MKTIHKMKVSMIIAFFSILSVQAYSQKFAIVDTEYILQNIPEYQDAQNQLDQFAEDWQKEIEQKFGEVDAMYRKYQADAVLLPEDMKRKRQDEIISAERDVKKYQDDVFGQEGLLFKKREELVLPIQERVYAAIEKIAQQKALGVVFDKSSGASMLFSDPKLDISDEVLEELGYSYNANRNN